MSTVEWKYDEKLRKYFYWQWDGQRYQKTYQDSVPRSYPENPTTNGQDQGPAEASDAYVIESNTSRPTRGSSSQGNNFGGGYTPTSEATVSPFASNLDQYGRPLQTSDNARGYATTQGYGYYNPQGDTSRDGAGTTYDPRLQGGTSRDGAGTTYDSRLRRGTSGNGGGMKHHQKRGESSRDGGGTSYTAEDDNELAELFSKASLNKRNRIEDEPAVYGEAEDEIDATTWGANKRMSRKGNSRNSRQSWRKGTRIRETEGPTEPLDPSYQKQSDPKKFFKRGTVFACLWSEPAGQATSAGTVLDYVRYGEQVYSSIRRFIVVERVHGCSHCLPIMTYSSQGCKKRGIRVEDHAIVYMEGTAPTQLWDEPAMVKDPIEIIPATEGELLEPASRLNYCKIYPVEHFVKVRKIGQVSKTSLPTLLDTFSASRGGYRD